MLIYFEGTGKIQLQPGQKGVAGTVHCCHIVLWLGSPRPKPTGVLEHCREGEFNG